VDQRAEQLKNAPNIVKSTAIFCIGSRFSKYGSRFPYSFLIFVTQFLFLTDKYQTTMKKRILILMMLLTAIVTGAWAQFTANSYFLTGTIAEWWLNSNYELTMVEEGLYKITDVELTTSDLLKVVKSNINGTTIANWYPDGMDNNQQVDEDGTYTIYFRPAGDGTEAEGYTYIPYEGDGSGLDSHGCTHGGYMLKFEKQVTVHDTEYETACDYFVWHGNTYTASGEYTYDDGTDIYKLNLTIHYSTSEIWDREVFIGQHFNEYPFDFDVTADTPLTQTGTNTNADGCDNVITLNLTIVPGPGVDISDTEIFPDDMFRSLIGTQYDTNHDGYLSDEEIAAVTRITIRDAGVTSLKGIEQFTSLKELECQGNSLSSLDLTKNTALTGLWTTYNQLQKLDLSKNQALELLDCGGNQLTSLDLSQNKILTELSCRDNQLTSLDVLQNTALELLYCDRNKLTALVLPEGMNRIEELFCYSNQIKGEAMTSLVESLPQAFGNGLFIVIDTADNNEQNEISTDQVAEAKGKGWNVLNEDGTQYPGTTDIHSIDNGELAIDNYYTLDGRKLQAMPTVKGVYIVNGKKVVIK